MKPSRIIIAVDYGPYREEEFIEMEEFEKIENFSHVAAAHFLHGKLLRILKGGDNSIKIESLDDDS